MSKPTMRGEAECFSLFGVPLYSQPLRPEVYDVQKGLYEKALRGWEEKPEDADAIIWLGRRTAYLGRLREAASIFSEGARLYPEDSRMPRHRGHRFISLRLTELGIEDLERAAQLEAGKPDAIEPDGLPNTRGIPVSSLQFNIYYHLGLGYYLIGDLEAALGAYKQCMAVSEIPDKVVATAHWQYMTLRMIGRDDEAAEVLKRITPGMDIIENHDYYGLLLMYKEETTANLLLQQVRSRGALAIATSGYGIGNWYMYNGDDRKAAEVWREVIATGNWPSFGYIAAEADMKRLSIR